MAWKVERMRKGFLGLAALAALMGCTATGDVRDPAVRRLTWFSYVSGDDMQCELGLARLRLIHNAVWGENVRAIDVTETPGVGYAVREVRYAEPNWSEIEIGPGAKDWPWRGKTTERTWSAAEYAKVEAALAADGAFAPLAAPVALESRGFFWTAAGCKDGKRWFHAWAYPGAAYAALGFPAVLAPLSPSGEAFAAAHPDDRTYPEQTPKSVDDFVMKATANGVDGRLGLPRPPGNRFLP